MKDPERQFLPCVNFVKGDLCIKSMASVNNGTCVDNKKIALLSNFVGKAC